MPIRLVNSIVNHAVDGVGPLDSAAELAEAYRFGEGARYDSVDQAIAALIRWEASKSFGTGFVTGLGGLVTLPITIPSGLYAAWVVQARLAAAIACLRGYDPKSEQVRTFVLLCLLGNSGKEALKDAGVKAANLAARAALKKLPGRVLIEINKKIGFRLITKTGEKGVISLVKLIPLAGGIVGGTVDAASTAAVGHTARAVFTTAQA